MTTVVQSSGNTNLSGVGSCTIVFPIATGSSGTANSIIVEIAGAFSIAPTSINVTDNKSNSYANNKNSLNGSEYGVWVFSCLAPTTTGVTQVTVNFPQGGFYGCVAAQEVSGLSALDKTGSATVSSSYCNVTSSGADTSSTDFVVGCVAVETGSSSSGISDPPTGYTSAEAEQNDASYAGGEICYRVNSSQVTDSVSWHITASGSTGVGILVSFSASGGSTPTQFKFYANGAVQAHQFVQTAPPTGIAMRLYSNNTLQVASINANGQGTIRLFANGQLQCNNTITV